jgi:methionyl-tRNA formyltransferase
MKYIFFGTSDFSVIILDKLIAAHLIPVAVICNPDKPMGRKKIITPPPVKEKILIYNDSAREKIILLQPDKVTIDIFLDLKISFDFFLIAAYSKILTKDILQLPRLGVIGVHPSLLPKYRGMSPIQSVILNGDSETGTTLFLVDEKIDHGPIIAQKKLENYMFNQVTTKELNYQLALLSAELLIDTIPKFYQQKIIPITQDDNLATYTKKFSTQDAYIEWVDLQKAQQEGGLLAIELDRKIRAFNPEPGAWTLIDGKRIKILEAILINDNKLKLMKIQKEGRKPQILA